MSIVDLQECALSYKNGSYGGMAGYKEGIIYNDSLWIVKYPKNITHLKETEDKVYSSSSISEYLGSHIFSILGIPVHDTILGYRNDKVVVACKDFLQSNDILLEIRTLKNLSNRFFEDMFDRPFGPTGSTHIVDLEELLLHLQYNPILSGLRSIHERFVIQAIVDILINNNDRNNGNWGLIRYMLGDKYVDVPAPVFDNGSSFSSNLTDAEIEARRYNLDSVKKAACNGIVAYGINGKNLTATEFCKLLPTLPIATEIIPYVVSLIGNKLDDILDFLWSIPTVVLMGTKQIEIMSEARKEVYAVQLKERYSKLLQDTLLTSWKNCSGSNDSLSSLASKIK